MATWSQLGLQDAASPIMSQLIMFHDHAMVIMLIILTLVTYAMVILLMNKFSSRYTLEAQSIETLWTILPAVSLLFLAFPSLRLLYLIDEVSTPTITIKSIGHQWYWSYEYSDFMNVEFDAYMTPPEDLQKGMYRLLEVDNRTVLPMFSEVRILVTAADVIHSWTVPALGIKADAVPGRLNQLGFIINRPGTFYGQCSEICGANHSFMPIVIESVNNQSFINWISSFKE